MKIIKLDELPKTGKLILIYSETGVGKTTSCFQSLPDPIAYFQIEPRNPYDSIDAADRPDLQASIFSYENWFDLIETISNLSNFSKHNSVVFDSLTHLMLNLSHEIEDESFNDRTRDEQKKKPIVNSAKLSMEGWGGVSSQMSRFTKMAGRLAEIGKIVVCTALLDEHPKWDRELAAAPALRGREYPRDMPGFFDLIGFVQPRGGKYPPMVSFESDGNYMAKWTGRREGKKIGPLNFRKILKIRY